MMFQPKKARDKTMRTSDLKLFIRIFIAVATALLGVISGQNVLPGTDE